MLAAKALPIIFHRLHPARFPVLIIGQDIWAICLTNFYEANKSTDAEKAKDPHAYAQETMAQAVETTGKEGSRHVVENRKEEKL